MNTAQRTAAYAAQNGSGRLTGPQQRRITKKAHKEADTTVGRIGRLRKRDEAKRSRRLSRESVAAVRYLRAMRSGWRPDRAA